MTKHTAHSSEQTESKLTVPELKELLGEDVLDEIKAVLKEESKEEQAPIDPDELLLDRDTPQQYGTIHDADSDLDLAAFRGAASSMPGYLDRPAGAKLTRKEAKLQKKSRKKGIKEEQRLATHNLKKQKKNYKSIKRQLKDRDKELSGKTRDQRYKRKKAKDVTAFIGYERMYEDGICEVEEGLFSSTLAFPDTSYHSLRDEMQKGVFASMCRLYDQFGADTLVQLNVINTPLLKEEIGKRQFFDADAQENVHAKQDAALFNEILNDKLREGVSNIRRQRFLTVSVSADSADDAAPKLARMENESTAILSSINSKTQLLSGSERLSVLFGQLNPLKPFHFDYQLDIGSRTAQTTKDVIAPSVLDFKPEGFTDCFKTDGIWGQVLVMKKFGSELSDRALSDIVNLPIPLNASWFAQPMDKAKAVAFVRQRSAWIDKEIIEEQRTAVSKGYDFELLPAELKYSKRETEDVLDHLQNKNQRLYVFTGLVYTYAATKEQLDNQVLSIISAARQNSIEIDVLEYRQKEGLNSILPLGHNHINISRMFTTAQVGIFMPFATVEIDDIGGNYCGQNKDSNNLVNVNRKNLVSPMGIVCGKPGSGKSMFVKTEMTGTILSNPKDELFCIDRAGEYTEITERYGGNTWNFGVGANTHLNPFDVASVEHLTRDQQVAFKIDALLAQAGASGAQAGRPLAEIDQSIITRCANEAFYQAEQNGQGIPLLEDFYRIVKAQPEPEARDIALRYERFVTGPYAFFNHQSNVNFKQRINDFNLKELPDSMLVFTIINICEAIRNRMYYNFSRGVRTWLYVEEIQSMFAYPEVLAYFSRFAAEGRKFGLLLTGITQNATALLNNEKAQTIVLNADFVMLLKQSPLDRQAWSSLLSLSEQEEGYVDERVEAGDGLLIAGKARVPIRGKFPRKLSGGRRNILYDLFSTNPTEREESQQNLRQGSEKK